MEVLRRACTQASSGDSQFGAAASSPHHPIDLHQSINAHCEGTGFPQAHLFSFIPQGFSPRWESFSWIVQEEV